MSTHVFTQPTELNAFSDALDRLYYAGRPLLFTIILEGTLLLGAILGLLYAWLARPDPYSGRRLPLFDARGHKATWYVSPPALSA